ncbi:response regulator transcription factor [Plantibacter flavus]|uniref:response regulator transcription factor n=1 Tax=Plantibacter flavus TaxID=150123 RepID=UPI0013564B62|nr:response regulator transcription factor [Plantibacter flavus]
MDNIAVLVINNRDLLRMVATNTTGRFGTIRIVDNALSESASLRPLGTKPDSETVDGHALASDDVGAGEPCMVANPEDLFRLADLDADALHAASTRGNGFVLQGISIPQLVEAIRAVSSADLRPSPRTVLRPHGHHRGEPLPPAAVRNDKPTVGLTPRERSVLLAMARGRSNAEISQDLFITEATVKTHVGKILTKLAVRDRLQAVVWAYQNGVA